MGRESKMKYKEIDIVYKDFNCDFKIVRDPKTKEYVIYDIANEEQFRDDKFEVAYSEVAKLRVRL